MQAIQYRAVWEILKAKLDALSHTPDMFAILSQNHPSRWLLLAVDIPLSNNQAATVQMTEDGRTCSTPCASVGGTSPRYSFILAFHTVGRSSTWIQETQRVTKGSPTHLRMYQNVSDDALECMHDT